MEVEMGGRALMHIGSPTFHTSTFLPAATASKPGTSSQPTMTKRSEVSSTEQKA